MRLPRLDKNSDTFHRDRRILIERQGFMGTRSRSKLTHYPALRPLALNL